LHRLRIALAALTVVAVGQTAAHAAPAYSKPTILTAEEALARLGFDVGKPDGVWDAKTERAMNALRTANGLPAAKGFTGSSLALVHKLSPGAQTLPHPGLFVVDVHQRRAELKANSTLAFQQCRARVGHAQAISALQPRAIVPLIHTVNGFGPANEDWFSTVLDSLVGGQAACISGDDGACQAIVDYAEKSALTNALEPENNPPYRQKDEDEKYAGNLALRQTIVSYGIARQFTPLPADREAVVLDWMKRRVDLYHHIVPGKAVIGDMNSALYTGHGIANLGSAFVYGVLVGDRSMMKPELEAYQGLLKGIRADGSMPSEARRGAAWFHYSNQTLAQLLAIEEMARAQGVSLGDENLEPRYSIPHAVSFLLTAIQNYDVALPYAKANIAPSFGPAEKPPHVTGINLGWLPAYLARYGEDDNIALMRKTTMDPRICSAESISDAQIDESVIQTCERYERKGQPVPFGEFFLASQVRTFPIMGYDTACLQAKTTWSEMLKPAKAN
jgi:peptidoglycan hydrolase-like protein with peptidoglycan-binding domain